MNIDVANYINSDIFSELNLENLSEEQKKDFIQKFIERVQKSVLIQIIDSLTDEDRPVFDQIIAQDSEEEIAKFIQSKNIDIEQLVSGASVKVKKELKTEFAPDGAPV